MVCFGRTTLRSHAEDACGQTGLYSREQSHCLGQELGAVSICHWIRSPGEVNRDEVSENQVLQNLRASMPSCLTWLLEWAH